MGGVVKDIALGAQSLGELDFARLCRARGLPAPDRQVVRRGPKGRIYLDVRWRCGVVVEIDGIQHTWGLAPVLDALRQNGVTLSRDTVLRIPNIGLRLHEDAFMDQVAQALRHARRFEVMRSTRYHGVFTSDGPWCGARLRWRRDDRPHRPLLGASATARRHRQGRHGQDHRRLGHRARPRVAPAHVLLTEVEGRQGISQTFDVPPLGTDETRIVRLPGGGEVVGLSIEPKAALLEYLQLFYKLGRAGQLLEKFGAIDFATTIAPGVRDVLLIGKIYEANRRRRDGKHKGDAPPVYDGIVLDAPPTGRIGRFLSVNSEVADLARVGPIASQATSITRLLESEQTVVHVVTLLEEMPVQETLEAIDDLRAKGLHPGAIIVNMVREPLLDDTALDQAREGRLHKPSIRTQLGEAGVSATPELVDGLLEEARDHAQRIDLEREQLALLEATGLPIVRAARTARPASTPARCASSPTSSCRSSSTTPRAATGYEQAHA